MARITAMIEGQPVRIKKGWGHAGRKGVFLGEILCNGRYWVSVLWEDADDPDLHKADAVEPIPDNELRWPRPWKSQGLLIIDAKGTEVVHLGAAPYRGDEMVDLINLIVESVNKSAQE